MTSFTDEQRRVIRQLSDVLGKTEQEIMNTPYEKIIRLLVDYILVEKVVK
jgi:hypothetical protein